jgi:hypothetical protein
MTKRQWVWFRVPRGPIPKVAQNALRVRLERHARTKWKDQCREVVVRFRGPFAYVDAFRANNEFPSRVPLEERAAIEAVPAHLCRLGYLGSADRWQYAFYKYITERYALSLCASGSFGPTPEEAFDSSAGYLCG